MKNVLIVDDNALNLLFMAAMLKNIGFQTRSAENSAEALRLISEGCPDIILMDIELNGESGYELLRSLKADPRFRSIPVVALSGLNPDSEQIPADFVDFIRKPASIPVLTAVLSRFLVAA